MKNFTSLLFSALTASSLLVGCIGGDDKAPDDEQGEDLDGDGVPDDQQQPDAPSLADLDPIPYPKTCLESLHGDKIRRDGEHILFVNGDENKPWSAYCVDMDTDTPKEYLTLPNGEMMNWSQYAAGGRSPGMSVDTRFEKFRIDPISLKVDIADLTFATSTGSVQHLGGDTVESLPVGVAMSCGGGFASASVDVAGTGFRLFEEYTKGGDANAWELAMIWPNERTMEIGAEGDCASVWPTGAEPMPSLKSAFVLRLEYAPL